MKSPRLAAFGALAVVLLAASGSAVAKRRTKVAILELSIQGDAPPELRPQLEKSLAGGLYAAGWEVVSREEVADKLRAAPELIGCTTTTCLERIGELVGAKRFVRALVDASGAAYTIELQLLGADVAGAQIRRVERTCSVCTIAEANDEMSRAALALREEAAEPVRVLIRTAPPGAAVTVDGEELGPAPRETSLPPGEHVVRATLHGHLPAEERVTIAALAEDQVQEIALTLPREPGGDGGRGSRFGAWKWVTGGVAVAALVGGIALIAIDGDGTDCPGGGAPCRDLYDTIVGGVLLSAGGAAAGGLATWMFMNDTPRRAPAAVGVAPARGGAVVGVTLTF